MSREIEDRIASVAARQQGVITRAQLADAGLSRSSVTRRIRSGRLRTVHRGVFVVGPIVADWAIEMAAVLAAGPGAVVSHLSGLAVWDGRPRPAGERPRLAGERPRLAGGRPRLAGGRPRPVGDGRRAGDGPPRDGCGDGPFEEPVDVTVENANRGNCPGIRMHRVTRLEPDEWTVHHGIPVTTPARTLVDVAGATGSRELEAAVARLEREGLVSHEEIERALSRHRRRRGTRALRAVIGATGGPALTRSEAESLFLSLVRDAELPVPETNVSVGRYEIDFLWRAAGIGVEVDGFRYHSLRPRFEGDRRKDAWLLAMGIRVLRLSWRQIAAESTATIVQVGQALALARGSGLNPET